MTKVIYLLIAPPLLFLCACGGGGGNDAPAVALSEATQGNVSDNSTSPDYIAPEVEDGGTPSDDVDAAPVETVVDTAPVVPIVETTPNEEEVEFSSTALLEVPSDYDWKMEFSLPIEVSLKENEKAFLSVCTDYSYIDNSYQVNYQSCILRTSVINSFSGALNISNDRKKLIAVVWYLDPTIPPHFKEWAAEDNLNLSFVMSAI